ncbi:O-sialoglycoprotein endopeptidase [Sporohalobacter salinus]|uniref:Kae1-like domain-containing protein n=1 Tax=Sporohalobacter salinus TaxID=1494606 RepID=UPI0019613916|nr:O-sialoglycoprotein endopeptidase [Sporohalobacter salinus]MBM7622763.1 N6-L-threonylcarbamoyladenine synthase [Sporohalobacter salinus]
MSLIMGIDTSNYTTSAALLNQRGDLVAEARNLLPVSKGERGLRQSEAVFKHIEQFPEVIEELGLGEVEEEISRIVVSTRPREAEESYMPVFRVGEGHARSIAEVLGIPIKEVSHQAGHLQAGIWSADGPKTKEFLAVHISGGTTEIMRVNSLNTTFEIERLGSASDLHAGQFIDRVGVELGLDFPAGPQLEELAKNGEKGAVVIPSAVDGYDISFSGPNSAAMRAISAEERPADIALAVQRCIVKTLEKVLRLALKEQEVRNILIVGGVAANLYLRENLKERLEHPAVGGKLFFASPEFSSDNAVGVAALGLKEIN